MALCFIGLAVALTFWLTRAEFQSGLDTPTASAALDPEVRKAAEAGDAGAQFRLGLSLMQDTAHSAEASAEALRWLQLAAENGNTEAMVVLGRMFRSGVGILQNFGQSSKWIQTAAAGGNPEGMLELGRLYRDGVGAEKDLVRAYVWFNRASAARNMDAVREREAITRLLTLEELKEAQEQSSAHYSEIDKKPSEKSVRK
ncbi:tetratricopeptide repeat protein [Propionivibrio sp.]|uniref:tetratricopeptide repeat protein n=1 Tax=Propionivibrio sp. TaxID=2212460 RepID=UPI003BF3DBB1